jgi:hypothetical protein
MVDMSVRADDRANLQIMATQDFQDAFDIVPWIDDDRFPRDRVSEDRAVALQQADGYHFVDKLCGHPI